MIIFNDIESINQLDQVELRNVIQKSLQQVTQGQTYDPVVYGRFVVVEAGDAVSGIEAATGCEIVQCSFNNTQYGDPGFMPSFEWLVEHSICYEAVFVLSSGGYGIDLIIPKLTGIDTQLLSLCSHYASPANPRPQLRNEAN